MADDYSHCRFYNGGMWNKPKNESNLEKIRREVEDRKRTAEEAGLDRLILDVYHRSVRYYPVWIKSPADKKYVYPEVTKASEKIEKEPSGDTYISEFSIGAKNYKITSERRGNILKHDVFYILNLYLNGQKVFAISEKHDVRLQDGHYYTLNIDAYVNEDWVEDFRNIKEYQTKIEKEAEDQPVEDKELMGRLTRDFNLEGEKIVRVRPWPKYKFYRLFLLLVILGLVILTFQEFLILTGR